MKTFGVTIELHRNGQAYRVTRFFWTDAQRQQWLRAQETRVEFVQMIGYRLRGQN